MADSTPIDQFIGLDWTRPAQGAISITAGSSALSHVCRGLFLGTAGNLTVTHLDGTSVTYKNLAAGVVHPIACTHVTAAANGAADIIGIY